MAIISFPLLLGGAGLLWAGIQARRVWVDATRRGFAPGERLRLALKAVLRPDSYWWDARLRAMSADERAALLEAGLARLGLRTPGGLRCPLCGQAEIEDAWRLEASNRLAVRREATCPACDFRLDACRHCRHFRSEGDQPWGVARLVYRSDDLVSGQCSAYKRWQPVRDVLPPDVARPMERRGLTMVRAPTPIPDSYLPLEQCRAFALSEKRLKANQVPRPGKAQRRLMRLAALMQEEAQAEGPRAKAPDHPDEAMWLW